MQTKEVI